MKRLKIVFLITILGVFLQSAFAKSSISSDDAGIVRHIDSKSLNYSVELQIYLPAKHHTGGSQKYPVMYIMDGDWFFLHGVGYQKSLTYYERSPEFIVVGIKTDADLAIRQDIFRTEAWDVVAPKWIGFLSQELIPYIDKHFQASKERIYFGWEIAGTLGQQIFSEHSELFTGYILANRSSYDYRLRERVKQALGKAIQSGSAKDKFFYVAVGSKESWEQNEINSFKTFLTEKKPDGLTWRFDVLDGQDHYSVPAPAIYNGLQAYFADYPPIRFYSLQELTEFGGLMQLYKHYQERGERYGVSTDIHPNTKHYLFVQTYIEKNITAFIKFFKEFKGHFETYVWYDLEDDYTWFGEYCLENNEPDIAIAIFNIGSKKFQASASINGGLADAYRIKENYRKARKYYQNAIELAKTKGEPELAEYEAKLKQITGK